MTGIPLRIADFTGRYQRMLRRFTFGSDGSATCAAGYHSAHVIIGEIGEAERKAHGDLWPHDDERWPLACTGCSRPFGDGDQWQLNDNRVCRLPDGTEFVFRDGELIPA